MQLKDILQIITTIFVMLIFLYYIYTENRVYYYMYMLEKCQEEKLNIVRNCSIIIYETCNAK